jgi:4-hydroxybenzoate polyprenyltransferase
VFAGFFKPNRRDLHRRGRFTERFVVETAVVEAGSSKGSAGSYLRLVRPKQWTKNGFVLAGVVFAHEAHVVSSVVAALLAFVAFCALSGAVYAANDVLDVEEDRKHPLKRLRPVASGDISPRSAIVFAIALAAAGLVLGFAVQVGVGIAGLAYLALQAIYTTALKHTAILDVMSISAGFVIRALAGVAAVGSPISPWLIVCTALLTLFLGFSKRRHEIASLGDGATIHRKNLRDYSVPLLDEMMNIMISATIIAYVLYTFFEYENYYMMASIPFVVYGVFRYMLLVHRNGGGNPDTLLLRDRPLQIALLLWLVVVGMVIYVIPLWNG